VCIWGVLEHEGLCANNGALLRFIVPIVSNFQALMETTGNLDKAFIKSSLKLCSTNETAQVVC
jgi:hypothetical protein